MTISEYIKKPIDYLNPTALAEDLSITTTYYFTCVSYLADREEIYSNALADNITKLESEDLSAKAKELKAKANCSKEKKDVDYARGLVDSLELRHKTLITLISKAKEEMRLSGNV